MKAKATCFICKKEKITDCEACISGDSLICGNCENISDNVSWEIIEKDKIKRKLLNIPYYSQHRDVKDEYWKPRACGILCLKSILDFLNTETKDNNEFIEKAKEKGVYGEYGWIHQGLIDIAKDFGIEMERKEFKSDDKKESEMLLQIGIDKIVDSLKNNKPIIVSAIKKWSEEKKFHMVVLTGFEVDESGKVKGFYYNDTDYQNEKEGKDLFIDIKIFKKYWRRLAIFVG